jgi:hypothetical protein
MRVTAALFMIALAGPAFGPAFGAVNKDGGKPSVNPCEDGKSATCAGTDPQAAARDESHGVTEPMVIFLDAEGETLARMPISRFRVVHPDAKLPAELDTLK